MHNDHLGWILTCPSNLGTGLRAGAMVKVPLFSARDDFKAVCKKMGLQVKKLSISKISLKIENRHEEQLESTRPQREELGIFQTLID